MKAINEVCKPVARPEKILQFGEGNFLRAFADWMLDIVNEKTDFNGNAVLIQPLEQGMAEMINAQQGLYTTVLRGVQNGKTVCDKRTITSVSRCINPYHNYDEYMKCAENPDLRFVISNTTEAGIAWLDGCKADDKPPASFPAKVTQFLFRRFKTFGGAHDKGLVFIPCELIDKNGDHLHEYVIRHAKEWKLGDVFINWVENDCYFCNSLVDRIVPGYPRQEAEQLCDELGYKDNLLDAAEIFHLWVIESKKDFSAEFPHAKAGLNVIWTDDMSFYRTRKVRILNGTHTMFVPAAFQYGLETVEESIHDKNTMALINKGLFEEIIPSMDGDKDMLTQYAKDVLERFANPYIRHLLESITLNSVSKYKTRDLPSLTGYMDKFGKVPEVLSFSMAALISFYRKNDKAKEDPAVLSHFEMLFEAHPAQDKAAAEVVASDVLSQTAWWGEDLTKRAGLLQKVSAHLADIWAKGMKKALVDIATGSSDSANVSCASCGCAK